MKVGILFLLLFLISCGEGTTPGNDSTSTKANIASANEGGSNNNGGSIESGKIYCQVREMLANNCKKCHNSANNRSPNLEVSHSATSVKNYVTPHDPENSDLYFRLITDDNSKRMPRGGQLDQKNIDLVKSWIEDGANTDC